MEASSWTDNMGNLWLFGGEGYLSSGGDGNSLNDLWEFNVASREWVWVGGSDSHQPSCDVTPGVYGTKGVSSPVNIPGSRSRAVSWTDNQGNFWLFGGAGADSDQACVSGYLNDLWEFNPSTRAWKWVAGSNSFPNEIGGSGQSGVYGVLGIPDTANTPGGRQWASGWSDGDGNLWISGGMGFDSAGTKGILNDLWKFSPATMEWTWMGGSNTVPKRNGFGGLAGTYGSLGVAAATNVPGSRYLANTWTDTAGNLWLFGGYGYDSTGKFCRQGNLCALNDLWKFNPISQDWTWIGGSNAAPQGSYGQSGSYGSMGTPGAGNMPGGRGGARSWTDKEGKLWLFGGYGLGSNSAAGFLNDLWSYAPETGEWTWIGGENTLKFQSINNAWGNEGIYGVLGVTSIADMPGGRESPSSWIDSNGTLWLFGGFGFDSNFSLETMNDLWQESNPAPTPTFSPSGGVYSTPQTVTLADGGADTIIRYTTDGTTPTLTSPIYSGPFKIRSDMTLNAFAEAPGGVGSQIATVSYVIQEPVTIFWQDPSNITYGQSLGTGQLNATAFLAGTSTPVDGTFTYSPAAGRILSAGANVLKVTFTPNDKVHYLPSSKMVSIRVNKANLTVTATDKYQTYGSSVPSLTYTISGLLFGQNAANVVSGAPSLMTTSTATSPIGSYPIRLTPGTLQAANYNFTFVNGTLRVTPVGEAATPIFSLQSGAYKGEQTVVMTDTTPGAIVYYTLQGDTPTTASLKYAGPIKVSESEVIRTIAVAPGYIDSAVVAAKYTIE
jgi:N-acetylneuraminic acid mutarotase